MMQSLVVEMVLSGTKIYCGTSSAGKICSM